MTAIEAMKYLLDKAESETPEGHQLVSVNIPVDIIREIVSTTQQWIPCETRLPEESGTYIVTAYDGTNKRVSFVKYQKTLRRWDLTGARSYWRILAYKPLPEPWKGEHP